MHYETLGRSGLKVSRACLGTMNFGSGHVMAASDEQEAARIVNEFLDAGNNFVDTADAYSAGQSEETVGRAIKGRREDVVLATKAASPMGPGPHQSGLSRKHLTKALDDSLRRLDTDYIDLYQAHHWDDSTPIEETMATLDGFVRAGKVRYLGASNFTAAQIVEAQWAAARAGTTPLISLQPQYSLVARYIEAEILPACERHGMGTLVWSPLGGGVLSGRYRRDEEPAVGTRMNRLGTSGLPGADMFLRQYLNDANLDVAEAVAEVAGEMGTTPASVALAWVAQRPGITSVIIGPRTTEHLHQSLEGLRLELPAEAVERLEQASRHSTLQPVNGTQNPVGSPAGH
ncbi:aldo/keto reductase [Streptomyces fulvoviolaceus]|uniref:aldo/keto reductase n=1 Tax=Streptomyces fulvoviolaceus TaxID=285535 RepID=UPI0004CAA4ED|nr:aldo/keto reductase [Streptomyces fulvoviolaceus]